MEAKQDEYYQARNLYFGTGLSQTKIAGLLKISTRTLQRWIEEGAWKQARYAAAHAPMVLVEQYYHQLGMLNKEIASRSDQPWASKEESEIIRRISSTIKTIDKGKPGVAQTIQVFEAFADTMRRKEKDSATMRAFTPYLESHVKQLVNEATHFDYATSKILEEQEDKEYGDLKSEQDNPNLSAEANSAKEDPNDPDDSAPEPPTTPPTPLPPTTPTEKNPRDYVTPPSPSERAGERSHSRLSNISLTPSLFLGRTQGASAALPQAEGSEGRGEATPHDQLPTENCQLPTEKLPASLAPLTTYDSRLTTEKSTTMLRQCLPIEDQLKPLSKAHINDNDNKHLSTKKDENTTMILPENDPTEPEENITTEQPKPEPATTDDSRLRGTSLPLGEGRGGAAYYATLPPNERPSPFREGNILWVNSKDDINDDEMKMSDSIRYYPDMDKYEIQNRKFYEMRIKMEAEDNAKKEKEKQERKKITDNIITKQIYKDYYQTLHKPCTNIYETIFVNGEKRNKMAFQYNIREYLKHPDEQVFLTDEEFLQWKTKEATLDYMRMTNTTTPRSDKHW